MDLTIAFDLEGVQQIVDSDGGRSMKLQLAITTLFFICLPFQTMAAELRFVGIGVTIQKARGNKFRVSDLRASGPAMAAGVLKDDLILRIDGRETNKMKLDQVVKLISTGSIDSMVVLGMAPRPKMSAREVSVSRKEIVVDCRMYGPLNLTYSGSDSFGRLSGWIGPDRIDLNVQGKYVSGVFKGETIGLQNFDTGNEYSTSFRGYYRGSYIDWWASNGYVYGFQGCIE
jgi:hypothetical protein